MKRLIFLLLIVFGACKDSGEFDIQPYPYLVISKFTINSPENVTVDARFIELGTDSILRHGFVWHWTQQTPHLNELNNDGYFEMDSPPTDTNVSQEISHQFLQNQVYFFRYYTISATDTTYSGSAAVIPNP